MKTNHSEKLEIINLGPQFENFWAKASNLPFNDQLKLWDEMVENPNADFYEGLVNGSEHDPDWKTRKTKRLQEAFVSYKTDYPEILKLFNNFEITLNSQINKYKQYFPDAEFNVPIIAMPGASFNGKGGETKKHETVLAFGVDIIHQLKGNTDILYSHELFHIYHVKKANITAQTFMSTGKMTLPLLLEGLASFASHKLNPNASMEEVYMDLELANLKKDDIHFLAQEFLKISNEKAYDEKNPITYRKWFGYKREKLRDDLPWRVGYLLGFKVVEKLEKSYTLLEVASWSPEIAHEKIVSELAKI
jgi:hypothetical protein